MAAVVGTMQEKIAEVEAMKAQLKEVKLPQICLREDLHKELEKLKATGEEEAALVQRFLEQSLAHQLISKAGVGKPYVLTPSDASKAAEIFKNLMALGYDSLKSATICRALFNEQTPEDMTEAFNQFDEEGKGSIQAEEVKHFLPALGVALPPLKMHHFLQECGVGSTKEDHIDMSGFASVLKHANPNGMESLYTKLPNFGIGSTLYNVSSGVSHFREAYSAGLSDSISLFDTRKAGVIIENFAAADLPKEMAVKVCRAVLGDQSDEAMQDAFKYFDKDGLGTIDAAEFKKCLPLMGEDLSEEKLQELFAITDKNSSGCLDLQEFTSLVKALNPKEPAPKSAAEAPAAVEAGAGEATAPSAPANAGAPAGAAPAASASASGWFSSFFGGGGGSKDKKEEEAKKPEEEAEEEQAAPAEAESTALPKDRSEGFKVEGADTGVDPEEAKKSEDAPAPSNDGPASAILGSAGSNGGAAATAEVEAQKKPEESSGENNPEEESVAEKKPEDEAREETKPEDDGSAEKKPEEEGKA